MNSLSVFKFEQNSVRTMTIGEEIYFVGKDIAEVLGYKNPSEALQDHCKFVKKINGSEMLVASDYAACRAAGYSHNDAVRVWTVIPERDVYRLIMRSKLPSAEQFEDWVVGTVLPAIRKTGGYIQGEEHIESEDELVLRAMQVLERKIAAMKPKADYHDKWMSSKDSFTTTDIAKQLGVSAIKLNSFMREQGIKWQNKDLPISGYEHWFKVIDVAYNKGNGETGIKKQCRITPEGAKNIASLWEKKAGR